MRDELLLLLALGDQPDLCSLLAAASIVCHRSVGPESVDHLLESGGLGLDGDVVTLGGDATAASVLRGATPHQIERAHRAWADTLSGHPLAQARHRSLATRERSDGGARLAIDAARQYQVAGQPERSLELLRKAGRLWLSPDGRSQSLVEAAATAFSLGRPDDGRRLLREAATERNSLDLDRISSSLLMAFTPHLCRTQSDPTDPAAVAVTLVAWEQPMVAFSVLANAGSSDEVQGAVRMIAGRRSAGYALAALARLHQRDYSSTLPLLTAAVAQAKDAGLHGVLTHLHTMVGELAVELGDPAGAKQALAVARKLAVRTEQPLWGARADNAEAMAAVLGHCDDRDVLVRRAHRHALTTHWVLRDRTELLDAMSFAAADRWEDAYGVVRRLAERDPIELTPLLPAGLISLLADAATHSGHRVEGRALVSRIAQIDTHCEQDLELADLLYATAVLSDERTAETCFEVALALDPRRLPWLRARTSLAYGGWLRRQRRVTESRTHLLDAQRIFVALDLPAWIRRAQAELRASGMKHAGAGRLRAAKLELSPQEFEIAQLVARGLTNRQIGAALHLSPRTIGSHLYRIFPKLDVTSRTELAALLDAPHQGVVDPDRAALSIAAR